MWKNNGLSIVVGVFFLACLVGHSIAGWKYYNEEQQDHHQPTVSFTEFLCTPEFGETVFENWESEFLQMAMYVLLTVFLYQRGSSESKDPEGKEEVDEDPEKHKNNRDAPYPVRRGGWLLTLYKNSLSLAFFALFVLSFTLHAANGARRYNIDQKEHGKSETLTTLGYMEKAQFWYESLQNWQSEFLAVLAIVVLSIHLRQWGSPESKPVHAPHTQTGE